MNRRGLHPCALKLPFPQPGSPSWARFQPLAASRPGEQGWGQQPPTELLPLLQEVPISIQLHPGPSGCSACMPEEGGTRQRLLVFSTQPGEPLTPGHGAGPICRASLWPRDSLHAMVLSIAQRRGRGPRARPALDAPSTAGAPRPSSSAGPPHLTNTPGTQMEKQKGAVQPLGSSITWGGGIMT